MNDYECRYFWELTANTNNNEKNNTTANPSN